MSEEVEPDVRTGLLGELEVELELVRKGWHPVRLDTAQMAANADLLAVNKTQRLSIQVKTTSYDRGHSHSGRLGFGFCNKAVLDGAPIFNRKRSPLIADVIIGVSQRFSGSSFVVMPVAFAEKLCRAHCEFWYNVPRRDGERHSPQFSIYLSFTDQPQVHREHHERMQRNLKHFEGAWDVLRHPVDALHDPKLWPLVA